MIVPNKYLAAPYASGLRKLLIEKHTVVRLRDVSRISIFADAAVYPIISVIRRGQLGKKYTVVVDQVFPSQVRTFTHASSLLKSLPDYIWGFLLAEGTELVQKLNHISEQLGSPSVSQVNASSTASEADSYGPCIVEGTTNGARDSWKIINTGLIERFATLWGLEKLTHQGKQYQHPALPKQAPIVSQNRFDQYSRPKLVFAKMALRIEAYLDSQGLYASMNTNFALEQPGKVNVSFLAAVCNSKLLTWIYEQYFGALRMGGGYLQFQAPQLRVLPIRHVAFGTPTEKRERLRTEGQILYAQFRSDFATATVLEFVDSLLPKLPDGTPDSANESSDVVHDFLAYLAGQMIELNVRRQAAVDDFVLDLEGVLPAASLQKIGRLWTPPNAPKSDAKNLEEKRANYENATAAAEQILGPLAVRRLELRKNIGWINEEQWKWLLKRRLKKIASLADVIRIFRSRQPAIADLDKLVANTDHLIDLIVYALYGLNEDEITVVERTASDAID